MAQKTKQVFILGGGIAGVRVAHLLSQSKGDFEITLIDRNPYHLNPGVLQEIATAYVPWEKEALGRVLQQASTAPYEKVFDGTNVIFKQGIVSAIDGEKNSFSLTDGNVMDADFLVLSLGAQPATRSVPGVVNNAFLLTNFDQAVALRSHIVSLFLRFRSSSFLARQKAFSFAIVGGGTSGVSFAAELATFLRKLCDLHKVEYSSVKIIIYEETEKILHEYLEPLRESAKQRLRSIGVDVQIKKKVTAVGKEQIMVNEGVPVPVMTTVWLAGTRTNDVLLRSNLPVTQEGGVVTNSYLQVTGFQNLFAAGDCTHFVDPDTKKLAPDVGWEALKQAEVVAENINRKVSRQTLVVYHLADRPIFVTIGGKYGLIKKASFCLTGFWAWLAIQCSQLVYLWSVLPNALAVKYWFKSLRVKVAND